MFIENERITVAGRGSRLRAIGLVDTDTAIEPVPAHHDIGVIPTERVRRRRLRRHGLRRGDVVDLDIARIVIYQPAKVGHFEFE